MEPQGWQPVEGHELLEHLHPAVAFVATEDIRVLEQEGTTGLLLAAQGDPLSITSRGNMVALVANQATEQTVLVQFQTIAGKVERS